MVAVDPACCCEPSACCFCIEPCCPVYVVYTTCSGDPPASIQATFANNSCISEQIIFEELCCTAGFFPKCAAAVRVRAVCTGKNTAGNCAVDCTYVLEYASVHDPAWGGWQTTPTYYRAATNDMGDCDCTGAVISLSVEQRMEGDCASGEPAADASTCSDTYSSQATCEGDGGVWHAGVPCVNNPCEDNPLP